VCRQTRVVRWYIFKPKISIWVNFVGPWNVKGWHTLWPFGIYYGHLKHFMAIWYICPRFGALCQEKSGNPGPELPRNFQGLGCIPETVKLILKD
jgi:hypothetical protein